MNLSFLNGRKTHLTVVVVLMLCVCKWQGWLKVPDEVYVALLAVGLSFLRSGVARDLRGQPVTAQLESADDPLDSLPEYPPKTTSARPANTLE
jgi:hypothetical protein